MHRNSQLCGFWLIVKAHKKSVESDYCRSTDRGSRIAFLIKRQREAHAEYKYPPCYIVKVRVCAYAYMQMAYQNRHKRDNLYPVGHLSLLSSYQVEICEISISQNKALINAFLICLLPSAADVRHPSAQVHGAKVVLFFELSKKKRILLRFLV